MVCGEKELTIGEKIRELRKLLGITQAELANRLGVEQATVSLYESNKRAITIEMLMKIAKALGVDVKYFFSDEEPELITLRKPQKYIPVYDTNVIAGNNSFPDNLEPIKFIPIETIDADCAFIAHGHSMEPEIHDGDIVLVKQVPVSDIRNGEIIVSIYMNNFFVKRIYKTDNQIILIGDNEEYAPILIEYPEWFTIVGKVVEIRHSPKPKRLKL